MDTYPTTPKGPGFGSRLWRAFIRLLVSSVVIGLAGVAVVLLSQLNARRYALEMQDGKLVVLKGKLMPQGSEPWRPGDSVLADAYAPLDLDGTSPMGVVGARFDDRDALDRALFSVIETLARSRTVSDEPKLLEQGLYYLRRAEKLSGITDEQRLSLKKMKSDVSFYSARLRLEDAQKQIDEALSQLKLAAQDDTRHARSANQMLLEIEPNAKLLSDSLRRAVHSLSQPAPIPVPAPVPAVADAGVVEAPAPAPVVPAPAP